MNLTEYLLPLRKWWWLLLISTLIAGVASFITTRQQPNQYYSSVALMVGQAIENPNPTGSDLYLTQELANTYIELARRQPVRDATMKALGIEWLPEYWVAPVANTHLIEIAVLDTDPLRTQRVADELAKQLIRQSPGVNQEQLDREESIARRLDSLEEQMLQTENEVTQRQNDLAQLISASEIEQTESEVRALQGKLNELQKIYNDLLEGSRQGALNTIEIVEEAYYPSYPLDQNQSVTIIMAALIGLLLATGAAYLLEFLDDSLKNPEEVQKVLNLPTLGAVPSTNLVSKENNLVVVSNRKSPVAEAYRILRTNLQFASLDKQPDVLLVTSPSPGEGKTQTTTNLAAVLAQAGQRVILVDLDLHRPRQHKSFNLSQKKGVTSALLSEHLNPRAHLQKTVVPGLLVLTSGSLPPNPSELLNTTRMKALLAALKEQADIVLIDSPPVTALADAAILSTLSDGVLVVLDAKKTRRDMAKRALKALQQVNAKVIGIVLNRMPTQAGYYYYYKRDGDYYTEDESKDWEKKEDEISLLPPLTAQKVIPSPPRSSPLRGLAKKIGSSPKL